VEEVANEATKKNPSQDGLRELALSTEKIGKDRFSSITVRESRQLRRRTWRRSMRSRSEIVQRNSSKNNVRFGAAFNADDQIIPSRFPPPL